MGMSFFGSIIVAMILFGVGGGLSIYEGITQIQHPEALRDPIWNYVVMSLCHISGSNVFAGRGTFVF
jgi:divalent metal cation (Fe/Co/Zn/Cd) transporter